MPRRSTASLRRFLNSAVRSSPALECAGRDLGLCVRCGRFCVGLDQVERGELPGRGVRWSIQHRVRGRRSDLRLSNLLLLCGHGASLCHGAVTLSQELGEAGGWAVSRYEDTTLVAVSYSQPAAGRVGRFLLSDDGGLELAA